MKIFENIYIKDLKTLKEIVKVLKKYGIEVKNVEEEKINDKLYKIKEIEMKGGLWKILMK